MTIPTFDPPVAPHAGSRNKPEFKLLKAEFGDGYTQTTRDGLNHIRDVFTATWDDIDDADAFAVVNFLKMQGGDEPFLYAPPGEPSRKWTCDEVEITRHEGFRSSVTATFRQCFNVAA